MYLRKCISCGKQRNKFDFIRINKVCVDSSDPIIYVTDIGKTDHIDGRTAYICPSPDCFKLAKKKSRLERNLKCKINSTVYDKIHDLILKK